MMLLELLTECDTFPEALDALGKYMGVEQQQQQYVENEEEWRAVWRSHLTRDHVQQLYGDAGGNSHNKKQQQQQQQQQQLEAQDALVIMLQQSFNEQQKSGAVKYVMFCLALVDEWLVNRQDWRQTPVRLLQVMHENLLHTANDNVQEQICKQCESWYNQELPGCDSVVAQCLVHLLMRAASQEQCKLQDVKRIYALRQCLELFDFQDASSQSMKQLLVMTFGQVALTKWPEGRKFLALLMTLSQEMVPQMHQMCRMNLQFASPTLTQHYGEIYYRSWRAVIMQDEQMAKKIEQVCIQDLMNVTIHCRLTQSAERLRAFLAVFHQHKKTGVVDQMLFRLYQPILWRGLNAPNSGVRRNSCWILIDAFPLRDQEASEEEFELLIQKQFDILTQLMRDIAPEVREAACAGLCRIFAVYWEMIPAQVISDALTVLANELAHDINGPQVRNAIITGFHFIMEHCPLAHAAMRRYLVPLGKLLHDKVAKNRVALLDLLLFVRNLPDIRFWDVVDLQHLLYRLQVDAPAIVKRIITLLSGSFFPANKTATVWITRATVLHSKNSLAARRFYYFLVEQAADLSKVVELTCRLYEALHQHACLDKLPPTRDHAVREMRQAVADNFDPLLSICTVLLDRLAHELERHENDELKQHLVTTFDAYSISQMVEHAKQQDTSNSMSDLLYMGQFALSCNMVELSMQCTEILEQSEQAAYGPEHDCILECFFKWGLGRELVTMSLTWLEDLLVATTPGERPVKVAGKHLIAMRYLRRICAEDEMRPVLFRGVEAQNLKEQMTAYLSAGMEHLRQGLLSLELSGGTNATNRFYQLLLDTFVSFAVHNYLVCEDHEYLEDGMRKIMEAMPLSTFEVEPAAAAVMKFGKGTLDDTQLLGIYCKMAHSIISVAEMDIPKAAFYKHATRFMIQSLEHHAPVPLVHQCVLPYLTQMLTNAYFAHKDRLVEEASDMVDEAVRLYEWLIKYCGVMAERKEGDPQLNRLYPAVEKTFTTIAKQVEKHCHNIARCITAQLMDAEEYEFAYPMLVKLASAGDQKMMREVCKVACARLNQYPKLDKQQHQLTITLAQIAQFNQWSLNESTITDMSQSVAEMTGTTGNATALAELSAMGETGVGGESAMESLRFGALDMHLTEDDVLAVQANEEDESMAGDQTDADVMAELAMDETQELDTM